MPPGILFSGYGDNIESPSAILIAEQLKATESKTSLISILHRSRFRSRSRSRSMQQGSDYGYYSHHYPPSYPTTNPNPNNPNPNPNPNPAEYPPSNPSSVSAPLYSHFAGADYSSYIAPYPPYSQTPDPPSAPSYTQPQPRPTQYSSSYQPYNPSPYPSDQLAPPSSIPTYPHDPNPNPNPNPNPSFSPYPSYDIPYESTADPRFDHYGSGMAGGYGRSRSGFGQDFGFRAGVQDDVLGAGVYRYDGGGAEPYGARGTGGPTRSSALFDDFGRSLSFSSGGKERGGGTGKIARAVPKAEAQQDVKGGVQKFRVKLLAEGSVQSTMDVLCQIGLDGIRMLDPSTSRTLRIYPLETITRWEVSDPSIYSFWSKSFVDVEPRRIRLQSNSYTTSTILDTVAAATVQLKEMGGKESLASSKGSSDTGKQFELPNERKKGFDWKNFIKPANEEKDHWVPDEAVTKCTSCGVDFNAFVRKHHCRNCGDIFCDKCTHGRIALTADENALPVRVCERCMAEVTHRLSNAKEVASRSAAVHSHEDLARKLQEEMDKNRKSAGPKSSDGSGRRMREVACPTCTVHLQVQVPASGSETIECGVCQHPFLVSAH